MPIEPFPLLRQEIVYSGWRVISRRVHQLPNGEEIDFDIINSDRVATVVALTPDNQVVLASQFRPGPGKVLHELPGGAVDEGESLEEGAARELLEETGYKAGSIEAVGTFYENAYSDQVRNVFLARDCIKEQEPKDDPREIVQPVLMPMVQFREFIKTGQMTDTAGAYMVLDRLGLL